MIVDLHSHSNCSDGSLTPNELLTRAREAGVDLFAITDHDTLAAFNTDLHIPEGLNLVTGIEFSTTWNNHGVHIVGLNVDLQNPAVMEGAAKQTQARELRAQRIAEKLEKLGVKDVLEGARQFANNNYLGRPHFAEYLVACGAAATIQQAFKRYLGAGKAGDEKQHWASMQDVISWIKDSGGTAVLAHPLKYKLTLSKLKLLISSFSDCGGDAIEVVSGQQSQQDIMKMITLSNQFNLLVSTGSDFHSPGQPWAALGKQPPLMGDYRAVWDSWL